ncbi:hypothetical protein, partial [Pseudomonas sp.]|uniref:hypothetical protein n=1 Tax=Pseudomonas sp. TaxID=306 RepID=UPI003CC5FCE1
VASKVQLDGGDNNSRVSIKDMAKTPLAVHTKAFAGCCTGLEHRFKPSLYTSAYSVLKHLKS